MTEHRWRDITGPSVADDPDWAGRAVASPTFGDGTPESLALGEILAVAPRKSAIMVWFEVYNGQGTGSAPTSPTPATMASLQLLTMTKDAAGNEVWSTGSRVGSLANQRSAIDVELSSQGHHFIRLTDLTGDLPDPGSIRIFTSEAVVA